MSSWSSYPSIFSLGHRAIKDLLTVEVNVEEKVDGSQFSFGLVEASPADAVYVDDPTLGPLALKVRSKGAVMHVDAPEALFRKACETVKELAGKGLLHPGWTYRGETLAKPKHNALAYERTPKGHIILFDVTTDKEGYLGYEDKKREADKLGLECVPLLYSGRVETLDTFRRFLSTVSVLGGQAIEGVVVKPKNYDLYGADKKVLLGKFVSEAFKEAHRKSWGETNPSNKDVIERIKKSLTTPARWQKAILHLRERGLIQDDPRDIGLLIREIQADVEKEETEWVKDVLFKHFWPEVRRALTSGFPEWYKDHLLKLQFEREADIPNPMSEREL